MHPFDKRVLAYFDKLCDYPFSPCFCSLLAAHDLSLQRLLILSYDMNVLHCTNRVYVCIIYVSYV